MAAAQCGATRLAVRRNDCLGLISGGTRGNNPCRIDQDRIIICPGELGGLISHGARREQRGVGIDGYYGQDGRTEC